MGVFVEKESCCQLDIPLAIEVFVKGTDIPAVNVSHILNGDQYMMKSDPINLSRVSTKKDILQEDVNEVGQGGNETDDSDPDEVWWDGPNDPANPRNWSTARKVGNIFLISTVCFVTPLSSSIFASGIPDLMKEFGHPPGGALSSLVLSIFVSRYVRSSPIEVITDLEGFGVGPLLWAPMSEIYGRVPIYHISGALFVICSLGCARSTNLNMLIVFRFLTGCMGSAALTNGGGSIADVIPQEKRGAALSIFTLGPLLGPVLGPVCGGFLVSAKGWRWPFYLIAMLSGTLWLLSLVFLRESYPVIILDKKTKKLRKDSNNMKLRSRLDNGASPKDIFWKSLTRPIKMLFFSPIIFGLSIYIGIVYGYLYLLFSTFVQVFEEQYGFTAQNVGLTYLGLGIGNIIGLLLFGLLSDRVIQARARAKSKDPTSEIIELKPESRLPLMIPGGFLLPIGLFIYGWTADKHVQFVVPIFGTLLFGIGNIVCTMPIITYLVDAYPLYAASALAANTLIRAIMGAFVPLVAPKMYDAIGLGWGNSVLAFIATGMLPVPIFFYRYGETFRNKLKMEDL